MTPDDNGMYSALQISDRGTCSRLKVGAAIIAYDDQLLVSAANGVLTGEEPCDHTLAKYAPCTEAMHAEERAIAACAERGLQTLGTTLYVTHSPCVHCARLIVRAGISRVVYGTPYRDPVGIELLRRCNVEVSKWPIYSS